MYMEQFWQDFTIYISSITVIVAGGSWIIRKLIDNFFSHKLEKFKAQLEKEHTRYQITYDKLHTERAVVIKETYQKLVDVYKAFHSYMNPMQLTGELTTEEKQKIAAEKANDFIIYFDRNRIFFEDAQSEKIDKLRDSLWDCWTSFGLSKDLREDRQRKDGIAMWQKVWDKLNTEIPQIKKEVEKEFQKIIGLE
jgi:hypothetical protein